MLTRVEVQCKFLKIVAPSNAVNEFSVEGRFGLDGKRKRRMDLDTLEHAVGIELLVKNWHGSVDDFDIDRHFYRAWADTFAKTKKKYMHLINLSQWK